MFKNKLLLFKVLILFMQVLFCSLPAFSKPMDINSYFGFYTKEASFQFSSKLFVPSIKKPDQNTAKKYVRNTLKYTLGQMHEEGSIYGDFQIQINEIQSKAIEGFEVQYTISGKGVFSFSSNDFTFYIPYSLNSIYKKSSETCHEASEDIREDNFWYNWKPNKFGCLLVEDVDYYKVKSNLKLVSSNQITYPEYSRLITDNKIAGTIFFSPESHDNTDWNPYAGKDYGSKDYVTTSRYLIGLGYQLKTLSLAEIKSLAEIDSTIRVPTVEEYSKKVGEKQIIYRLIYSETALYNRHSKNFHALLSRSLKNDSLIIYQGHSGIGRNLNLKLIENQSKTKIQFGSQYQIMFFGSCMPYAYYTDMYFKAKSSPQDLTGRKNLDILGYGKESHFGNIDNQRLIKAIDQYLVLEKKSSYQDIVTSSPVDFFGVIGDEDNVDN